MTNNETNEPADGHVPKEAIKKAHATKKIVAKKIQAVKKLATKKTAAKKTAAKKTPPIAVAAATTQVADSALSKTIPTQVQKAALKVESSKPHVVIPTPVEQKPEGSLLLAVAGMSAGAAGLVAMLIAARILGVAQYGALGALLALAAIGDVWRTTVQLVAARDISSGISPLVVQRQVINRGLIVVAAIALLAAPLSNAIDVGGPTAVTLVGVYVTAGAVFAVRRGAMLAVGRRKRAAKSLVAASITRVVLSALGAIVAGVAGAIAASAIAELFGALICSLPETSPAKEQPNTPPRPPKGAFWLVAALAVAPPGLDSVLARILLSAKESGQYASAAALARGVLTVGQLLVVAAIPALLVDYKTALAASWRKIVTPLIALATACAVIGPIMLKVVAGDGFAAPAVTTLLAAASAGCTITMLLAYAAHTTKTASLRHIFSVAFSGVLLVALGALISDVHTATSLAVVSCVAAWLQALAAYMFLSQGTRIMRTRNTATVLLLGGVSGVVLTGLLAALRLTEAAEDLALVSLLCVLAGSTLGVAARKSSKVEHKVFMPTRRERLWALGVAGVLPGAATFFTWFSSNKFFAFFDITPFDRRSLSTTLWQTWGYEWSGSGGPTWDSGRVWEVGFYHIGKFFGDTTLGQRLYWATIVAFAAVGVTTLALRFTRHTLFASIAGLLAVWNGFFIIFSRNPANYVVIALASFSLALSIDAARGNKLRPWTLAAITLPCSYLGVNPPLLVLTCLWFVLCPFIASCCVNQRANGFRRAATQWIKALPLLVVSFGWWAVPWLVTALTARRSGTVKAVTNPAQYAWAISQNTLPHLLALTANFTWPRWTYFRHATAVSSSTFVWMSFLLPAAAFALPLFRKRSKAAWALPGVLVIVFMVGKGIRDPFESVNAALYRFIPGMWLLRQPFAKIGPFLVLGLATAAALTADAIFDRTRRTTTAVLSHKLPASSAHGRLTGCAIVACTLPLLSAFPLWTGSEVPQAEQGWPGARVAIPEAWYQVADIVNSAGPSKVLVLPLTDMYMVPTTWGLYGWDNLARQLFTRPTLIRNPEAYIGDKDSYDDQMLATEAALVAGDTRTATELLQRLGVTTIVVRRDIAYSTPMRNVSIRPFEPLLDAVGNLQETKVLAHTAVADVYQLPPTSPALALLPVNTSNMDSQIVRSSAPTVSGGNYPKAFVLRPNTHAVLTTGEYEVRRVATKKLVPERLLVKRSGMLWFQDPIGLLNGTTPITVTAPQLVGKGDSVLVDSVPYFPSDLVPIPSGAQIQLVQTDPATRLGEGQICPTHKTNQATTTPGTSDLTLPRNGACVQYEISPGRVAQLSLQYELLDKRASLLVCMLHTTGGCTPVAAHRVKDMTAQADTITTSGTYGDVVALRAVATGKGPIRLKEPTTAIAHVYATIVKPASLFTPIEPITVPKTAVLTATTVIPDAADVATFNSCTGKASNGPSDAKSLTIRPGTCQRAPVTYSGHQALIVKGTISGTGVVVFCLAQGPKMSKCDDVAAPLGQFEIQLPALEDNEPAAPAWLQVRMQTGSPATAVAQVVIDDIAPDVGSALVVSNYSSAPRVTKTTSFSTTGNVSFTAPSDASVTQLVDTFDQAWSINSHHGVAIPVVVDGWAQGWQIDYRTAGTKLHATWETENLVTRVRLELAALFFVILAFALRRGYKRSVKTVEQKMG